MAKRPQNVFDSLSPLDYRYWNEEVAFFLSENGFTRYKCGVEVALVQVLARYNLCDPAIVEEIAVACQQVTTEEVYEEEDRIGHDIRALVNCIRNKVSDRAKPFVHMTATSFDISDTASVARIKDCVNGVVLPELKKLVRVLALLTTREAETQQVGRTHGQHAVPITFGFAIAEYVSRLGASILQIEGLASQLVGKFSGAVGAYNASSLFFPDPETFEADVLKRMGLQAADHSTQIVQPEPLIRLLFECALAAGIIANLADDMRNLQRTEIGEVGEAFGEHQVGSSTMPQKRNPINFENAKSMWKIIAPRVMTLLADQISEHQRDLTNSASARTYGEMLAYLVSITKRITRTMGKLAVDRERLAANSAMQGDLVLAEPLQLILSSLGHPEAHEAVRVLSQQARELHVPLHTLVQVTTDLQPYVARMSEVQLAILKGETPYTGIAAKRALEVANFWSDRLDLNL